MRETFMVIVFDMDNTLVDEFGSSVRPGIVDFSHIQRDRQVKKGGFADCSYKHACTSSA
jgi:phosphoglycolate phosphatase-like HAD superfamily hydrolase